jgi:hypothetical protein
MCVGTTVAEVAAACRTCWPVAIVAHRSCWPLVTAVATLAAIAGSGRRGHW